LFELRRLRSRTQKRPDDPQAWYDLSVALEEHGEHDEAVAALARALDAQPATPGLCLAIGARLQEVEQLTDAIRSFQAAVELDPTSADGLSHLGLAMALSGDVAGGIGCLERARDLTPGRPEGHVNLANWLMEAGRSDEAVLELRRAVELDPQHQVAHALLGRGYRCQAKFDDAVRELRLALTLDPQDTRTRLELGIALARGGDSAAALSLFQQLRDEFRESAPMLVNLGLACREIGLLKTAVRHFRDAIRCDPTVAEAHSNLGIALLESGTPGAAIVALAQATALRPEWALAHYNLGLAYEAHGDPMHGEAALATAARLAPLDRDIVAKLHAVRTGEFDAAALTDPSGPPEGVAGDAAAIVGTLEVFAVPDLLEFLKNARRTGILHISSARGLGDVHLDDGRITSASSPSVGKLGDFLRAAGCITDRDLQTTIVQQQAGERADYLGSMLVERGLIDTSTLRGMLVQQVKSAIGEMVGWTEGMFAFEPAPPGEATDDAPAGLDVDMILLDVMRELDERNRPAMPRVPGLEGA
jgi:Flp pilus assembly protein TadD